MAFDFATKEEIRQLIDEEDGHHEFQAGLLDAFLEALNKGGTLFHDKDTDEWFLVEKGMPIPPHLQAVILRK